LAEQVADSADAAATILAGMIAANAPSSIRLLKQAIARAAGGATSSDVADAAFDGSFASPDFAEGLAAFRARRAPEYGR
jgi:enoyl-CoA hydratase/carnithine racemase